MQTLAACHGLASGLLHHWETILYAPTSAAPHSMVYALLGEYDSHRTHFATFQVIAKPGPITRLLLLGAQVRNTVFSLSLLASYVNLPRLVDKAHHGSGIICSLCRQISKHVDMLICFDPQAQEERCLHHANGFMASSNHAALCTDVVRCSFSRWWRIIICMLLQIAGYFVQGLICLVYMPLCFQLARFTAEAASRVYCDLAQDIAAAQVPDIANANVPAVTRMFYSLPVRK